MGVLSGCSEDPPLTTPDGKLISTSTTRIAEVNVVSADRDYARTCLAPTATDPGKPDVARIVVTDPALLDAVCGLGIGPKVVAVTADAATIPKYLGPQLGSVPTIGSSPDAAAVATAKPDVVLTTPATAASAKAFGGAKTETIAPGTWQEQFQSVATALGRTQAGKTLLDEFATETAKTGKRMDASHDEVSLVRFGADSEMVAGTASFGGQILSMVGAQRPVSQRQPQQTTLTDSTFKNADADLILVSFQGADGLAHGKEVLLSDRWLDMGAPTWKRVLIVNDDIWYNSSGLAAGWLVLNDIKGSLDGNSAPF
ncbi:ABC transporter substrate-binding protein [Gordonia sp. TBRC 11910]|uniref:ABC transporter substrate-binding protein n=1 Tax=Gordonia asplenii TaxID=2725283 RepID=A0A848KSP4_9ACTN|nr:ABC transporter substrate-binding protein [Gordonia asplenii]NMO01974.1 ABC transporter substrate-binding protein [Gordonia asplenii]